MSEEVHRHPLGDGRWLVYAPLRRSAFVGNEAMVRFLEGLRRGHLDRGADPDGSLLELLRRLEMIDADPVEPPAGGPVGLPRPTSVTLFLTTACNLRCTYCYAAAGDTPVRAMPLPVATRGIDFVSGNARAAGVRSVGVIYHGGGEPTAHWEVLTRSFAYAKDRAAEDGLTLRAITATNGVLTDARAAWIAEHLDEAVVSFDGPPEVHDVHRSTARGAGSGERVLRTLRTFDGAGLRYGVRMTVTADHVQRLPDSVRFLCHSARPARIQAEPAFPLGRGSQAPSPATEAFLDAFRRARSVAREHGVDLQFSAARAGLLTNHFCGVSRDTFALSPDGGISSCYEVFSPDSALADIFFYGRAAEGGSGYEFDAERLARLRAQSAEHRKWCEGCLARWSCAGDCYHKAVAEAGDPEFRGGDRCHLTRELTVDQVLDRISRSGGLFWHEPPRGEDPRAKDGPIP